MGVTSAVRHCYCLFVIILHSNTGETEKKKTSQLLKQIVFRQSGHIFFIKQKGGHRFS